MRCKRESQLGRNDEGGEDIRGPKGYLKAILGRPKGAAGRILFAWR